MLSYLYDVGSYGYTELLLLDVVFTLEQTPFFSLDHQTYLCTIDSQGSQSAIQLSRQFLSIMQPQITRLPLSIHPYYITKERRSSQLSACTLLANIESQLNRRDNSAIYHTQLTHLIELTVSHLEVGYLPIVESVLQIFYQSYIVMYKLFFFPLYSPIIIILLLFFILLLRLFSVICKTFLLYGKYFAEIMLTICTKYSHLMAFSSKACGLLGSTTIIVGRFICDTSLSFYAQ